MAKIKFYAKKDLLMNEPFVTQLVGQPTRYVGRSFDFEKRAYIANQEPAEFELGTREALRLIKRMRLDDPAPLYPADEFTAEVCGCEYEEPIWKEGAWITPSDE